MAKVEEFEKAFMGKSGEVSIIRGKLSKVRFWSRFGVFWER